MKNFMFAVFAVMVAGCSAFAGPPREEVPQMTDAATPATDGGPALAIDSGHAAPDSGVIEMPIETDAGAPLGEVPTSGVQCDPDRDRETYDCSLEGCDRAYLVCLGDSFWHCVPDTGAVCVTVPATDAGTDAGPAAIDAGSVATDAGSPATDAGMDCGPAATDAGSPVTAVDAGPMDFCVAGSFVGCWLTCGYPGHIDCNTANGRYDSACNPFALLECPTTRDAGTPDAGTRDAGSDAGRDLGTDSGPVVVDAGTDAGRDLGTDAGPPPVVDAGTDAGPSWTSTGVVHICIDIDSTPARIFALCPTLGATPDLRFFSRGGVARSSDRASCIDVPMSEIDNGSWNATVWCQTNTAHLSWDGYASPRVIAMPLNTAVSSLDFTNVTIDGRPARANTFYCWDTTAARTSNDFHRVQVQVVPAGSPLPTNCSGSTGTP